MEKLKLHSPDFTQENIAKLAELFPNCVTESRAEGDTMKRAIDFDQLRQELSTAIVEGPQERYQLNWPGKREALLTANAPIAKTLRPCREESVDFDTTQNLFIEGDNLDALKLLRETYLNKVKMIYIDPPYNTGKDFIYEDDFAEKTEEFLTRSNQKNAEGGRLVANTEANGRFHSDWLSMMYPRLKLSRNLLSDDGVLFISIDDNEQDNLKKICDETFGSENYVALIAVEINPKGRKNSRFISVSNDFCLVYAKNKELSYFVENIPKSMSDMQEDENGDFVHKSGKRVLVGENGFNKLVTDLSSEKHYSVYFDGTSIEIKIEQGVAELDAALLGRGFKRFVSTRAGYFIENTYTKNKIVSLFESGALEFKDDKIFEKNFNSKIRMKSILVNKKYDALVNGQAVEFSIDVKTTSAGSALKNLFESKEAIFPAPKNVSFIKLLISLFDCNEFTILDFFSGSGSTAEAVLKANSEDGGKRRFITVQLPEHCEEKSEAFKAGYKTIAEIGKERIRRAGQSIKAENALTTPDLDIGFRVLKVDSSNMKDVYYAPDAVKQVDLPGQVNNIREERTPEDLLFQVLLDWGVDLTLPITQEAINGKQVFFVDGDALAACFESGINEEFVKTLAARHPLRAVFRDAGFGSDSVKINIEQIFKLISPTTEVKSI